MLVPDELGEAAGLEVVVAVELGGGVLLGGVVEGGAVDFGGVVVGGALDFGAVFEGVGVALCVGFG